MNAIEINTPEEFVEYFKSNNMDYVDFGCSKGGSLLLGKKQFDGIRGLGIDISPKKVEITRSAGFDAVCYDINKIPSQKLAKFTILSHFLEHVPNAVDCTAFVKKACEISTDFVFIQQPFFDADSYLLQNNLKLFWSDWTGHPNRMTSLDMLILMKNLVDNGLNITYSIHARHRIYDSSSRDIHHISTAPDQHHYDSEIHPPKGKKVKFKYPVYKELVALITMPGVENRDILSKFEYDITLVNPDGLSPMGRLDNMAGFHNSNKLKTNKKPGKINKIIKKVIKQVAR